MILDWSSGDARQWQSCNNELVILHTDLNTEPEWLSQQLAVTVMC